MDTLTDLVLGTAWLVFGAYWLWSARQVKRAARSEQPWLQLAVYWLPLLVAVTLLGPGRWFGDTWLHQRFVPQAEAIKVAGVALAWLGIALAIWSRHLLGSNWSSVVQLKQDHELIERGPYRYIRHPIYTGLLLAFLGTALKLGDWRGLVALAIVFVSFWRKLRLEERWLGEQFGERYAAYRQRTRALIPGVL